ncbi:MAG TPA: hypothetical protein VHW69_15050 [Rhizomicrobium sp.]|nr:hypothetical protein [Rhizomicrobium sp.]
MREVQSKRIQVDEIWSYVIRADLKKTGKNASNHLLLDAIVYVHQRISELAKQAGTVEAAKTYFSDLVKFVRDAVIAVRLTVPNESNAFRVFETLNDTRAAQIWRAV